MNKRPVNPTGFDKADSHEAQGLGEMPEPFADKFLPREEELSLAMSYVKRQTWSQVLDCDEALAAGTVFPQLVKPFMGKGGRAQ